MKKIFTTLIVLGLLSPAAFAQTDIAQTSIKLGGEVGVAFVTMSQRFNGINRNTQFQPGFKVSGMIDFGFTDHFSMQPSISFVTNKGSESNYTNNFYTGGHVPASITDRKRFHVNYFQVPVMFLYKTGDRYSNHFFIGGGPYFGVAVGGMFQRDYSESLNGQVTANRKDYPIGIGKDNSDEIGRFDLGLQATAGFELSFGLYFRIFYGYGVMNAAPQGSLFSFWGDDYEYHQSGGGITVGFLFHTYRARPWNY